jgi:hypothetical protein
MAKRKQHLSEGRRAAVHERDLRVSEHVSAVVVGTRDEPVPKQKVIDKAVRHSANNGLAEDPFFQGDQDRLRVYLNANGDYPLTASSE